MGQRKIYPCIVRETCDNLKVKYPVKYFASNSLIIYNNLQCKNSICIKIQHYLDKENMMI